MSKPTEPDVPFRCQIGAQTKNATTLSWLTAGRTGDLHLNGTQRQKRRRVLIVGMVVAVAMIHFVIGSCYSGPYPEFVNGYLLDILLPMSFYFLLCLTGISALRSWAAKASLVFLAAAGVELAQYFGIPLLGRTFDPLDFVMYASGVFLAAFLDTVLFPRVFRFWKEEPGGTEEAERPG